MAHTVKKLNNIEAVSLYFVSTIVLESNDTDNLSFIHSLITHKEVVPYKR